MSNEQIYKAFGEAIAARRKQLNLTQDRLAKKVGMSRASIANIERGRQNVALHHIYSLAASLEVSKVSDLLPAMAKMNKWEEETMITLDTPITPKVQAQANELINSILSQRTTKRSET